MWKSYLESNSNFVIAPTGHFPDPSSVAGNARLKSVSVAGNKSNSNNNNSCNSNNRGSVDLEAPLEFGDNLVSPNTPVLFSSNRGLQLRTRRLWRTFGADREPRENYSVQFCDLERWMQSRFLVIIWRRKLSFILIGAIIVLFGLWSWAFYSTTYAPDRDRAFSIGIDTDSKHEYLLQKLISQANRVIQRQYDSSNSNGSPNTRPIHVKFIKPTIAQVSPVAKFKLPPEEYLFEGERLKMLQNQQKNREEVLEEDEDTSAERQSQYEHDLQRMAVPIIAGLGPTGPRPPKNRLVHLDLKGAPPKLSFLKRMLPVLKRLGATGLLIEYEDMFPYAGEIESIRAENAYRAEELKDFLQAVALHDLQVMPLVQTFGHMEYVLKLQGYEQIREVPESPQSICPSQPQSINFLEEMITQIVNFHLKMSPLNSSSAASSSSGLKDQPTADVALLPNFTHIHIGCDEVYRMAECAKCILRPRNELFLSHVTTLASFIRKKWPQLKVIIWDDMLRDMTLSDMQSSHIGSYVEPMIWVYANDIYRFIQPHLWDKYSKVFPSAWAASAFKGAFGESLILPPIQKHLENNLRWLAVIAKEGTRFSKGFQGIALTGWQRYDHFATLCELLPTAMPSLITCLSTVSRGYFSVDSKDNPILNVLDCPNRPDSRRSGRPWIEFQTFSHNHVFSSCSYQGSAGYKYMLQLFDKLQEITTYLTHVQTRSAWMSDYNVRHNFSSPIRVQELISNSPRYMEDLSHFAEEAHKVFEEIFDEHTIMEFIEQNIYPLMEQLHKHEESGRALLTRKTWPRRPLPYARNDAQETVLQKLKDTNE